MKRTYEWSKNSVAYRLVMDPPEIDRFEVTVPVTLRTETNGRLSAPIVQMVTVELTEENTDSELWEAIRRMGINGSTP